MNSKKNYKNLPGYLVLLLGIALILPSRQLLAQNRNVKQKATAGSGTSRNVNPGSKPNERSKSQSSGLGDRQTGTKNNNINNSGNKTNNIGSNNNKVNIDNSRKNVNVNVDNSKNIRVNNSRNTAVRRNVRPYPRPPYVYGGRRYMCYHPYVFHPYRPFIWSPMWHPWGFFVVTLATTAIILSVDNDMPGELDMASDYGTGNGNYSFQTQPPIAGASFASYSGNTEISNHPSTGIFSPVNQEFYTDYSNPTEIVLETEGQYYYDEGVYYVKADGGYSVVSAPLGATIKNLPAGYETVSLDDNVKNYYYGGTFYEKSSSGYKVVPPTAGALVEHVSDGGEEVKMGEITYVKLGETYFQPVKENGKDMYEVANVEEDK